MIESDFDVLTFFVSCVDSEHRLMVIEVLFGFAIGGILAAG